MRQKKFSLGYNHDPQILSLLDQYKDYIEYFYFSIPHQFAKSGRLERQGPDYINKIDHLISQCKRMDIKPLLLLNVQCEGNLIGNKKHMEEVIKYVYKLYKKGLSAIAVTNPLYIRPLKKTMPDLEIHSSVNCYTKSLEHAKYLEDLGVDVITLDRDINYKPGLINTIKDNINSRLVLMLNEGCLRNCPYRIVHFNAMAHDIQKSQADFYQKFSCQKIIENNPHFIFRLQLVRPEDLHLYDNIVDCFKIVSRDNSTSEIKEFLEAYTKRNYTGNMLNLLSSYTEALKGKYIDNNKIPPDFIEKMEQCTSECDKCNYCKNLSKNLLVDK